MKEIERVPIERVPWCTFTDKGLRLDRIPSWAEWADETGPSLAALRRALHFWIGDWLLIGEATFGEKYAQAVDLFGFDRETLANDAYVCRSVAIDIRRPDLTFGHHQAVAALLPDCQKRVLLDAAEGGWDVKRTRMAAQGKEPLALDVVKLIVDAIHATQKARGGCDGKAAALLTDAERNLNGALEATRKPMPARSRVKVTA